MRILLISTAVLVAATLSATAQQRLPQEPRGEDSSRSATPSGQLPGPDATTGQRGATPSGKIGPGPGSQSTPQEPRGEEGSRSATPGGEQPPPNPRQPRQ
jgi:hypothetical protein